MAYVDENTGAETYNWETGVYQLEENDPVQGGAEGIANRQARELATRSRNMHLRLLAAAQSISNLLGGAGENFNTLGKLQAAIEALDFSAVNLDELKAELRGAVSESLDTMQEIVNYVQGLTYLPTFQGTSVQVGATIDWSGTPERTIEIATNTQFDASNLIVGKTVGMLQTGAGLATFSDKFKKAFGSPAPSPGSTNYIQMKCINATLGSEVIIYNVIYVTL